MISAVNGFDIKNKESQNWDISEFLAKGGKVDKRNNLGQSIDEKGNLTDFKKSEFTVRFNGSYSEDFKENENTDNFKERNKKEKIEAQSSVINEYLLSCSNGSYWKPIIQACDGGVSERTLRSISNGETFISCPKKWDAVKKAIYRILAKKGINYVKSNAVVGEQVRRNISDRMAANNARSEAAANLRIKKQRPLFLEVRELYGKSSWSTLSKRLGLIVSAQYLSSCYDGKNSIATTAKWKKVESEMIKMIKEKKDEAKTA